MVLGAMMNSVSAQEIYAALSGSTMTIYYDDKKASRSGVLTDWTPEEGVDMDDATRNLITKAVISPSMVDARPTGTTWWFWGLVNLTTIDGLANLNTSEVTYMSNMFEGCSSLTSLDVSKLNTANVTRMISMFAYCTSLISLDVSNFNTSEVMYMSCMFQGCESLTSLDLSSFNTANVKNMNVMFKGCSSLKTIYCDDDWSASSVLEASNDMFGGCTALVGGKGTKYDDSKKDKTYARPDKGASEPGYFTNKETEPEIYAVKDGTKMVLYYDDQKASRANVVASWTPEQGTSGMSWDDKYFFTTVELDASMQAARPTSTRNWFSFMEHITGIVHLEYLNTSAVTNMRAMFLDCLSLTELDVTHFNTANVTDMSTMFCRCTSLTSLDVSGFNTENVMEMTGMFGTCSSLTTIYCNADWSASMVLKSSDDMFDGCKALVGGKGTKYDDSKKDATYARPDKGASEPGYFTNKETEPEIYAVKDGTKMVLYYDDQKASRANVIANWTEWNGTHEMSSDEQDFFTAVELDESMQAARPTSLKFWFYSMGNVTEIVHLDYLNTSEVTDMSHLFNSCGVRTLDLSSFNTDKVTTMQAMFNQCSVVALNISSFNTSNVTDMSYMFSSSWNLTELNITHFNTAKVRNMEYMFHQSRILELDLQNFSVARNPSMTAMFERSHVITIYCNEDWSQTTGGDDWMFEDSESLVGGNGTKWSSENPTDKTYARPDKTGQAGYFTLSPEKAVEELIDAIGEVEYTAESKAKIDEARAGYDALTKAQKEKVSNYEVLKAAEARYKELKAEAELSDVIAELNGLCEYEINLVTPGTFAYAMVEAMGDHTWVDIKHLCVSGPMNETDLSYLAQAVNAVTINLYNAEFEEFGACQNFKSLEKILLPPTCKTLKKEAFYRCEKLNYINLGEVETFGEQTFMYCERLPEVDLHSAKTLGHRVFEYCSALTSVSLPEATYVGTQCFVGCTNLESAYMPKATTIGGSAFSGLKKLKQVELCDDIEKFESGEFSGCTALLSVKLPSKLRYIGSSTFTDIIEVEGEWPKGIEYIGSGNFKNMNYMVIGPNVTQMLVASNKWQNIYCYAADPQAVVSKYNPFTADKVGAATLYVPRSSLSSYKLNQAYANFLHIYALDDDIDLLHIHSPYMMLSTDRITDDAQLILHPDAALKTSAPSPLKVGLYEQYIHLGPKQYTSQTVTEDGVSVKHYYTYLHHTGILHANSPVSSDEVTVHLIPMHKQWNFFMLPFDVSVQDISIWARGTGSKENGTPGVSQYVFREYSGANRASGSGATWVDVPADGVLQANKGYILYWAVEGGTSQTNYYPGTLSDEFIYYFRMPAMHTENHSNIFATGDVQVPLTHYSSEYPQNVSWNLVGNPYPCMYDIRQTDFDATMTMWNGTAYVAYSPIDDPYTLRPGEAFFVQAPDEVDAITFHEEGRYDATKIEIDQNAYQLHMMPASTRVAGGRTLYNFLLSDSAYSDRARLVINASASEAYDLHRDAAKMLSTDAGVPQLWIEEDGVRYAINECPAQDSYRMGAFIASDGEYRITLVSDDASNTIWLTDLHTNTVTNLSQGAYTFTAEAGMYAGRFIVTFGANAPTRVENGEDGAMQGTKLLIDGQLIIITPQGKRFNANGVEL